MRRRTFASPWVLVLGCSGTPTPVAVISPPAADAPPVRTVSSPPSDAEPPPPSDAAVARRDPWAACNQFPTPPGVSCNPPSPSQRTYELRVIEKVGPVEGGYELRAGGREPPPADPSLRWHAAFVHGDHELEQPKVEVLEIDKRGVVRLLVHVPDGRDFAEQNLRIRPAR